VGEGDVPSLNSCVPQESLGGWCCCHTAILDCSISTCQERTNEVSVMWRRWAEQLQLFRYGRLAPLTYRTKVA
jgi:hypothetical protein